MELRKSSVFTSLLLATVVLCQARADSDLLFERARAYYESSRHDVPQLGSIDVQALTIEFGQPLFINSNGTLKSFQDIGWELPKRRRIVGVEPATYLVDTVEKDPFGCKSRMADFGGDSHGRRMFSRLLSVTDRSTAHGARKPDNATVEICSKVDTFVLNAMSRVGQPGCGAVNQPWSSESELGLFKEIAAACGGNVANDCSGTKFGPCGSTPQLLIAAHFGNGSDACFAKHEQDYEGLPDHKQPTIDVPCGRSYFNHSLRLPRISRSLDGTIDIVCPGGRRTVTGSNATLFTPFIVPSTADPASFVQVLNVGVDLPFTAFATRISILVPRNVQFCAVGEWCSLDDFEISSACRVEFATGGDHFVSFADGSPVSAAGVELHAKPSMCTQDALVEAETAYKQLLRQYTSVEAGLNANGFRERLRVVENMHGFRVCRELLQQLVKYGEMEVTIRESKRCHEQPRTDAWDADPCCNFALRDEQCCLPRPAKVKVDGITKFDSDAIHATCPDPLAATAALLDYQNSLVFAENCVSSDNSDHDELWNETQELKRTCTQKVLGYTSCKADDDCYTECDGVQCVVPYGNSGPYMFQCYLDHMAPETERRMRRLWGLNSTVDLEEDFLINTSEELCVGPESEGFQAQTKWRLDDPACDDEKHFATTGEFCGYVAETSQASKELCLSRKSCSFKSCNSYRDCHIAEAFGNATLCENLKPKKYILHTQGTIPYCQVANVGSKSCRELGLNFTVPPVSGCLKRCVCEASSLGKDLCDVLSNGVKWVSDGVSTYCEAKIGNIATTCGELGLENSDGSHDYCKLEFTQEQCLSWRWNDEQQVCEIPGQIAETCTSEIGGVWGGGEECSASPPQWCQAMCIDESQSDGPCEYTAVSGANLMGSDNLCRVYANEAQCLKHGYQWKDDCEQNCAVDEGDDEEFCGLCPYGQEIGCWDQTRREWSCWQEDSDGTGERCEGLGGQIGSGKCVFSDEQYNSIDGCLPEGISHRRTHVDGTMATRETCVLPAYICSYGYSPDPTSFACIATATNGTDSCDFDSSSSSRCEAQSDICDSTLISNGRSCYSEEGRLAMHEESCATAGGKWHPSTFYRPARFNTAESCNNGSVCSSHNLITDEEECKERNWCKGLSCPQCTSDEEGVVCFNAYLNETECDNVSNARWLMRNEFTASTTITTYICTMKLNEDDIGNVTNRCGSTGDGWEEARCQDLLYHECNRKTASAHTNWVNLLSSCRWTSACTKDQCEYGKCSDSFIHGPNAANIYPNAVCVAPNVTSALVCTGLGGIYHEFGVGCVLRNAENETVCSTLDPMWVYVEKATTENQCHNVSQRCRDGEYDWNRRSDEVCRSCGGEVAPYYSWKSGRWESAHMKKLQWVKKGYKAVNAWSKGFSSRMFDIVLSQLLTTQVREKRTTSELCSMAPKVKAFKMLACACSALGSRDECRSTLDTSMVGEVTAFHGLSSQLTSAGMAMHVGKGDIPEQTDSAELYLLYSSAFEATNAWIDIRGRDQANARKLSSSMVMSTLPECGNTESVVNDDNQVVGQVVGNIVEVSSENGRQFSGIDVCSTTVLKNVQPSVYTVAALADVKTMKVSTAATVISFDDHQTCVRVFAPGRYVPVRVRADTAQPACNLVIGKAYGVQEIINSAAADIVDSGNGNSGERSSASYLILVTALCVLVFTN